MPVPLDITALSATPGYNFPLGSESPATTDDYLRAHAAFIAQLRDGKEPNAAAGTTAQYWRGDKTWQDLPAAVRAALLTGLSTASSADVAATDTVLAAIGKLQAKSAVAVVRDSSTGAARLPAGTTAQRPAGALGDFRVNTTTARPEYFNGSAWSDIGAITKEFISAEVPAYSANTVTFGHGLGVRPKIVEVVLKCKVAEFGYTVGDETTLPSYFSNGTPFGAQVTRDATNIVVSVSNTLTALTKGTSSGVSLTVANWNVIVRAWA